ncbi:MAG TPA: hypothetical protein VFR88_03555, partial [Microlunatus sp.]|nr:hypothetical protein [Microlunatus sp.]
VLGPLGAILAIPLTLLVKATLVDTDPTAAWATALFGSTRAMRQESEAELSEGGHPPPVEVETVSAEPGPTA